MLTGSDDFAAPYAYESLALSADAAQHASTWKRRAWALAIALTDEGHFGAEDLRQALLREAGKLDAVQDWAQCQRWLSALSRVASDAGLIDAGMIAELGQWADRAAARDLP